VDLMSGTYRQCITDGVGDRLLTGISENYAIYSWSNLRTWSYAAMSDVNLSTIAWYQRPIVEQDGHYFWTRSTDYNLMIDLAVQAIPADAGGNPGVFSSLKVCGGAYICIDSYGHIAWVGHAAGASNTYRSIAYTPDGGVNWQTKDGDWAAVIGAYAGGDDTGGDEMTPDIRYVRI